MTSGPDPTIVHGSALAKRFRGSAGASVSGRRFRGDGRLVGTPDHARSSRPGGHRKRFRGSAGTSTVLLPMTIWFATLVAIAAIDITGYLAAAARAQALADAAALAAVVPDIPGASSRTPQAEAERVVAAGEGTLERCSCVRGTERSEVTVSVPVPGLIIPTLGASRVAADAQAIVAPPEDLPLGPTRERAGWRADPG